MKIDMRITTDQLRTTLQGAQEAGGKTTVSRTQKALGMSITVARYALAEAVERGFLTVQKFFHAETVYQVTDKSLEELEQVEPDLSVCFEDLMLAWNLPAAAPEGQTGRVHVARFRDGSEPCVL